MSAPSETATASGLNHWSYLPNAIGGARSAPLRLRVTYRTTQALKRRAWSVGVNLALANVHCVRAHRPRARPAPGQNYIQIDSCSTSSVALCMLDDSNYETNDSEY